MATDVEAAPRKADERVRASGLASRLLARPELGALVGVVLVYVFFAIVAGDKNFVSFTALSSILNRAAPLGILAIAVALLMIAGEFDLSIGSLLGFSGMAIMLLISTEEAGGFGWPLWPAVGFALLLTALTGSINGLLVNVTK